MTAKNLALDTNATAIQTLELGPNVSKITVVVTTARVALPTGAASGDIVRIAANTDCYIAFGSSTIEASSLDSLFTQGVEIMQVPRGATHVAAIREAEDGILTITEVY